MNFIDAAPIATSRRTDDGYLIATAKSVRVGIQIYSGRECDMADMETVRVYRPPEEVFAQGSLQSFSHAPITIDHPAEAVTSENIKKLAVGEVSTAAHMDGKWVSLPLILKDAEAIRMVESGKRQLSAGYVCQLDKTPGVTPDGEPYDARQTSIKINHLAVVDRARAGDEARIGDGASDGGTDRKSWGAAPLTNDHDPKGHDMTMSTVVLGDKAVQVAATDAPAIEAFKADTRKQIADAEAAHKAALDAKDKLLADKDAELAKKDAALDAEKAKVLSDADLDKRVQERADLVSVAGAIAKDVKTAGLSDAAIRKAVVTAKLGDAAVAGKTEAYLDARFDILAEDAKKAPGAAPLPAAIGDAAPPATSAADAYTAMCLRDSNAWRSDAKKEA